MEDKKKTGVTRRDFIKGTAVGAGAAALAASGVLSSCATMGGGGGGRSPVFQPTKIGSLTLKNKIIRGPMAECRHDANGNPTPGKLRMYEEEAAGGVAMTITGGIGVIREDAAGTIFPHFSEASQIPAYKELADAVHRNGGKLCTQLMMVSDAGTPFFVTNISRENIRRAVEAFAQTAVWVRDAGFDAIEFHFAHGYLAAQFFSHYRNTRTDEYGGRVENRTRFAFEVVEAVRRALGRDFPLMAKINCDEYAVQDGSSQEETNYYVQGLADRGLDAIDCSGFAHGARFARDILSKEDQNYFSRPARAIAKSVNIPMIHTGGNRNIEMMEESLRFNDKLIGFGLARTILAEPDLPNNWQRNTNHTPRCISCMWCNDNLRTNDRALCVFNQNRA